MEYQEAERLVFDSAIAGAKNILGDMAGVIVAIISILLIVYALRWFIPLFLDHKAEKEFGDDYKIAKGFRERMLRGGVEGDIYKRKYNSLIKKMSQEEN